MVMFRKKDRRAVWRMIESQGIAHFHIGRSLYCLESVVMDFIRSKANQKRRGRPIMGA
jgi:hypothetical protein